MTTDIAAIVDRLDATDQIRQLTSRYALAVDTRNVDALVALYSEDALANDGRVGREALKDYFNKIFVNAPYAIHQVTNHVIDFVDTNSGTGIIYCRDERPLNGEWLVGVFQYWDQYKRYEGRWYFHKRELHRWYAVDALTRPPRSDEALAGTAAGVPAPLPEAWPSWRQFRDEHRKK